MVEKSLVRKLITYFLFLNIITVIVVGSYSYFRAKNALVERTFDQLTSIRIEKKYRIERLFQDRTEDITLIARSEDVSNIIRLLGQIEEGRSVPGRDIFAEYNKFLKRHFFSNKNYRRFYVVSQSGTAITFNTAFPDSTLSTGTVAELPVFSLFKEIEKSASNTIEDYRPGEESGRAAIYIGAPVTDKEGKITGVVVTEVNTETINSIMFENNPHNGLGESGESYLVGSDYLMRSNSRFQDNSAFKTVVYTEGVIEALKGNTGTSVIKDYRDITVLSSYGRVNIQGLDWAILAEIDEREAMVPIYSIGNNILFLGMLMSLLLFAIVYLIAKRISQPILRLKEAAEKISGDDYDAVVEEMTSRDEIGSLVKAFNEMSSRIKEQRENLNLERSMRLSSMIDGQELERLRLSRELHDGLAQSILAIKMRLERCATSPEGKARAIMKEVDYLFVNVIDEIRRISNDLMPAELSQLGLIDALKNLCREVGKSSGIEVNFRHKSLPPGLDDKVNTYLYRISQEALNNVVKHSEATSSVLDIGFTDNDLRLTVSDNGKGFDYREGAMMCGNGITNMKERVHILNGSFTILSRPGELTEIIVTIPINGNLWKK